jgi:hypothetical protein
MSNRLYVVTTVNHLPPGCEATTWPDCVKDVKDAIVDFPDVPFVRFPMLFTGRVRESDHDRRYCTLPFLMDPPTPPPKPPMDHAENSDRLLSFVTRNRPE